MKFATATRGGLFCLPAPNSPTSCGVFAAAAASTPCRGENLPGGWRGTWRESVLARLDCLILPNEAEEISWICSVHRPDGRWWCAIGGDGFLCPRPRSWPEPRRKIGPLRVRGGDTAARGCVRVGPQMIRGGRGRADIRKSWSLPWTSCQTWAAARACRCRNTRMVACRRAQFPAWRWSGVARSGRPHRHRGRSDGMVGQTRQGRGAWPGADSRANNGFT